jgi:DNA sulfur modification protein DndC
MTGTQLPLFPPRTVEELVKDIELLNQEIQDLYCANEVPWVIGVSWGKDSSCVLQLVWNAIAALPEEKRRKKIYVMTTDTLVENPIVAVWVRRSSEKLRKAALEQNMPVEPYLLYPEVKQSFWVCLMGKGYPAPRHGFRWCTERMKIKPTNDFIRKTIRISGEIVLVLGTRKAESNQRSTSMTKHEVGQVSDLLESDSHSKRSIRSSRSLPNSIIYSPIEDWRTDEVWMYLMQWENPWGSDNKDLFTMYRGATADNECPLVVDTSTPSCGDSRFGCWVCTMVSKDKSMEAMIQNDEEKEWLQPLLDIRNELDIRDDRDKRDFRRLYGRVELFERNAEGKTSIEPIPGPYTKYWREYWLRKVLEAQVRVRQNAPENFKDTVLITSEELSEIRRIWLEEKHEFDDSLPRIYKEIMSEEFIDIRVGVEENKLLGDDEWRILEELCNEDSMHLELMSKLLDTERQFYLRNRRTGIYKELEKCFETSSKNKEDAIEFAKKKRELTLAARSGDVKEVKKQLTTWANIKFSGKDEETDG